MHKPVRYTQLDTNIMLDTFLNSTEECIVIVNKFGNIEVLSKAYAQFLHVERDQVIGKHVTQVIENTRMHIVLKTGVSEIASTQIIRGENMIASRIPIIRNGEVIGVFGRVLFKTVNDLKVLYNEINDIEQELTLYKKSFTNTHLSKYSLSDIISKDPKMMLLKEKVLRVAYTNSSVLLLGESGTGKELFAHAIHQASKRVGHPFISVNCGAIPPDLLESELFGYKSGAFTGADRKGKIGLFKAAHKGVIFLDEVGELSFNLQVKLLRFLQEKEIKPIGSTKNETIDVRIIAATNRNLLEMVHEGNFRSDLYYRLSVVPLTIPPLRQRPADIPLLCGYLIEKICRREKLAVVKIADDAIECLQSYDWPGNVRELENVLESAINFVSPNHTIQPDKLPSRITKDYFKRPAQELKTPNLKASIEKYEKTLLVNALSNNKNNKTKASELLGISRTSLYEKMKKYHITG